MYRLLVVNVDEHIEQVVAVLLFAVEVLPVNDVPVFDDVDAVVPVVAVEVAALVDANGQIAAEKVRDDLAESGPAIVVVLGLAEATQAAVREERVDAIIPAVPVQVDADVG